MSGSMPTPPALFSLAALRVPALRKQYCSLYWTMTNRVGYWTDNRAVLLYTLFITARTSALIGDSEFCARA